MAFFPQELRVNPQGWFQPFFSVFDHENNFFVAWERSFKLPNLLNIEIRLIS